MALREGLLLAAAFNIDVSDTDTNPTKAAMLRFYRTLKRSGVSVAPSDLCIMCDPPREVCKQGQLRPSSPEAHGLLAMA